MMLATHVGARMAGHRTLFRIHLSFVDAAKSSTSRKMLVETSHLSDPATENARPLRCYMRCFSSKSGTENPAAAYRSFRAGKQMSKPLAPISMKAPKKKRDPLRSSPSRVVTLGDVPNARDELEAAFGPAAADLIRDVQRKRQENLTANEELEEALRVVDYFNSPDGSTEDLVGQRRAMALQGLTSQSAREQFMAEVDDAIKEGRLLNMDLLGVDEKEKVADDEDFSDLFNDGDDDVEDRDPDTTLDHNQRAHGDWSEMLVTVDRNTKLWRGGRLESYRALVIGGNMNGCGGFGIGKSLDPLVAVDIAGRRSKRNIFFVDRYQGNGLTRDLVGKQNSCVVTLRATDNGLRGNELCAEILKRFGITNCVSKSHGNRNPFNVVRATFKALLTHESLEDISLKRGKRIVSLDRAMRMQV